MLRMGTSVAVAALGRQDHIQVRLYPYAEGEIVGHVTLAPGLKGGEGSVPAIVLPSLAMARRCPRGGGGTEHHKHRFSGAELQRHANSRIGLVEDVERRDLAGLRVPEFRLLALDPEGADHVFRMPAAIGHEVHLGVAHAAMDEVDGSVARARSNVAIGLDVQAFREPSQAAVPRKPGPCRNSARSRLSRSNRPKPPRQSGAIPHRFGDTP